MFVTPSEYDHQKRILVAACLLALFVAVPAVAPYGPGRGAMTAPATAEAALAPPPAVAAPDLVGVSEPLPPARPRRGLARAGVEAAEDAAAASTQLAVAVLDRATGETVLGGRATEPYYTASLSKVVVAVDVLDRRRLEGLPVSDADIELLRRALGPSDDNAMNALWSRFDGAGAAARVAARLGLADTEPPRDPSQWGEMAVSAADTLRIWRYLLEDVPPADRELLVAAMDAAPVRASDGFDQAYGLLAPAVDGPGGAGAAAKQGWMCCFAGTYHMHSTGTVGPGRRFVVVVLTRVPRAPGWEAARRELTGIATAAVQAMT